MSTSDNYTRFAVGETVRFVVTKQTSSGGFSMTSREGVITVIQGGVLSIKAKGRLYGVFHEDARKVGERSQLTEVIEEISNQKGVKP